MSDKLVKAATSAVAVEVKPVKEARKRKVHFNIKTDGNGDKLVEIVSTDLACALRECTNDIEGIYERVPTIAVCDLFDALDDLESNVDDYNKNIGLVELINFIRDENKVQLEAVGNMLARNVISFQGLRMLLTTGKEVVVKGKYAQGAKIRSSGYRSSLFGSYLMVEYEFYTSNGQGVTIERHSINLGEFKGVMDIDKLAIAPISDAQKAQLQARGQTFAKIALGSHYMQFTGHMDVKKWWYWTTMRATGRIMVDYRTYAQFEGDGPRYRDKDDVTVSIPQDQLWMTDAYVKGFSFMAKQWGRFGVDDITDIQFRKQAYDQLVLEPEKKAMIRALVEDNSAGFSDIISGKGGGCIFLLHGEPGVGKTLTAEAVSELLQRPLYSVSVGELGTDTETMETNLRKILDVAQIWNAVILIDEADIFLEKRSTGDILRNAMVGVMLKLLEYHQGVMFLTTNRVTDFDSAFHSRISVALRYGSLTQAARTSIWSNLLAAANITGLNSQELAQFEINGRQIKNTIRMAQSLARQENVPVTAAHVRRCLAVSQQFIEDLKS